MKTLISALVSLGMCFAAPAAFAQSDKPTIVLVHGAFADASSWNGVVPLLEKDTAK